MRFQKEIPQDYVPDRALNKLNSKNYTRMIISLDTAYEGKNTFSLVKKIRKIGEKYYPGKWYLAGEGVSTYDLKNTVMDDMIKVNVMAISLNKNKNIDQFCVCLLNYSLSLLLFVVLLFLTLQFLLLFFSSNIFSIAI